MKGTRRRKGGRNGRCKTHPGEIGVNKKKDNRGFGQDGRPNDEAELVVKEGGVGVKLHIAAAVAVLQERIAKELIVVHDDEQQYVARKKLVNKVVVSRTTCENSIF